MRRIVQLGIVVLTAVLPPVGAADQDADDKAIRDLAGRFFDAYAAKDLDAYMALWSEKSPDYDDARQAVKDLFARTGPIKVKALTVVRVRRDRDAARVRLRVELAGDDLKTGKPHSALGRLDWTIDLGREGAAWKVVRDGATEIRLIELLASAGEKAERLRLMDDHADLIGPGFVQYLLDVGNGQAQRGAYDVASRVQDVAFEAAAGLGDKSTLARCHLGRGRLLKRQARHEAALSAYQTALQLFREANDREAEGETLNSIGIVHQETGSYPEALQDYRAALKIERDLDDRAGEAGVLNNLGEIYRLTSHYPEALRSYEASLKIERDLGDRAGEATTLNNIGIVYQATGRNGEALGQYQASLKVARDLEDRAGEARALGNIATIYHDMGRYKEALQQYQDVLKIARELGDRPAVSQNLNNIGEIYRATGRYTEALQEYQDSLEIERDLHDRAGEATTLNNIGAISRATGRYDEALQQYQAGLKIARDLGDRGEEGRVLGNIGNVYQETGRYQEALQQYQESLKVAREVGDRAEEAGVVNNVGAVYWATGRYREALEQYQESLKIKRDLGNRVGEASTLGNIGSAYADMGRYAEALRQYQDSLKIAREVGDRAAEAATLGNMGTVYADMDRYAEALRQYQDSLKIARDLGDRAGEATTLNNIGILYHHTGRHAEALQQYQASLKIARDLGNRLGEARALGGVGNAYKDSGRNDEALRQFQSVLKIARDLGNRQVEAKALINLGNAYWATGHDEEAQQRHEAALEIAKSLEDLDSVILCHGNLGRIYQAQAKWSEAVGAYKEAVRVTELLRANTREPSLQSSLLAQKIDPFVHLAECMLELNEPSQAFAASERMKARGLMDLLQQGKADLIRGMSDDERKEEQTLQNQLTALGVQRENLQSRHADNDVQEAALRDLTQARQDLEAFRRNLYLHRPDLATRRAEFTPASLKDLGNSLFARRSGLVVLSYLVGDKETLLFVLTAAKTDGDPARLTVYRIDVASKDLAEAVDAFRGACADPSKGESDADDLYRWLLAPAAGELADAKQLVVIPDGVLHTLPFQALKDPDGKYLIERFAVSYAPSVTALTKMEELGATRRKEYAGKPATLLAVGISDFGHREKTLPAAEKEAMAVVDAFGDGARLLPGKEATRAKLLASWSGRRYLHFATHGRLNSDAPLYSSLVLSSSGDGDEGVLYARDLVDGAEIPAELAVMSACQTGLGKHVGGEGLQGLSWSWFTAGVPSTVASQWSVGDDSTARLMKVFYARLKAGDSKADALRQAELSLLQDDATRHPFYWAPFVLVGDDK